MGEGRSIHEAVKEEGTGSCEPCECEEQVGDCKPDEPDDYQAKGHRLREKIKSVAAEVKAHIQESKDTRPILDNIVDNNHGEMIANATLAYRHLESSAMRIGKSIQAYNGGTSVLDKMSPDELAAFNARK